MTAPAIRPEDPAAGSGSVASGGAETAPGGAASYYGSEVVAEFDDYQDAQRLVDRMSDDGFPVERVRIVGTGLRSVEQVTGRLTKGRAALYGAGSGAWLGLLLGLLFSLFVLGPGWLTMVLIAVGIGAFWGAVFGFAAHWATRGRRDFSSVMRTEAAHYAVEVENGFVDQARTIAARL